MGLIRLIVVACLVLGAWVATAHGQDLVGPPMVTPAPDALGPTVARELGRALEGHDGGPVYRSEPGDTLLEVTREA